MPDIAKYRKPTGAYIGSDAKKLYRAEEARNKAINAAAVELGKVLELETDKQKPEYHYETIPEELLNILQSFDSRAGVLAAMSFLEMNGYEVKLTDIYRNRIDNQESVS